MYLNVEPYQGVLQQFEEILRQPDFFVRLTGVEGAGKSALLKEFCQLSESKGFAAALFPVCPNSPAELRKLVRDHFSLPESHNLHSQLEDHLRESPASSGGLVLFFDHVRSLSVLLELSALTEVQLSDHHMLSIVLCPDAQLNQRLKQNKTLHSVLQRISHSLTVPVLDQRTLPHFVQSCFGAYGKPDLQIEKPALTKILQISKGRPEVVVYICELLALSRTGVAEQVPISKTDVNLLASNFLPAANRSSWVHTRFLAGVAAAVLVFLSVVGWQFTRAPDASTPVAVSSSVFLDESIPSPVELPVVTERIVAERTSTSPAVVGVETDETQTIFIQVTDAPPTAAINELLPASEGVVPDEIVSDEIAPDVALSTEPAPQIPEVVLDEPIEEPFEAETVAENSLELAVTAWINAWQNQEMENYFASYHADFISAGFPSRAAWQANRQRNIAERNNISITVSEFRTVSADADRAEVNFRLHYTSPGYRDETLKMLTLLRDGERWLISTETNLEVRPL